MVVMERLLQVAVFPVRGKTLHGSDFPAICLHRKHQTRPDRRIVDQHCAGAAHPVFAADMGAGHAAFIAYRVDKRPASVYLNVVIDAVDVQLNAVAFGCHIRPRA